MEKLKKFFKNKKNLGLVIGGMILVIIIILGITLGTKKNSQINIEKTLKEMGTDFYENFYYENSGENDNDRVNAVKIYKETGIKVSLKSLQQYISSKNNKKSEEFINLKLEDKCDIENTIVIIYPKGDFEKKDYDIKVEMVCGFVKK